MMRTHMLRLHPTEMMLHRYTEGTLRPGLSLWVRRHLAACYHCRGSVSFTRSLREALSSLPAMIAMDSMLIERVIAERREGLRAVLPTSEVESAPVVRHRTIRRALGVAAAAIALAVVVSRTRTPRPTNARALTAQSSPASPEEFAVSEFFLPRSAFASEIGSATSALPPLTLDGTRLREGLVKYARFERVGGVRRQIGTESVELSPARIEGRDAWRVVQRRQIADTMHVETLYADRATLRTLGRTIRVQPYMHYLGITVRQRLMGDSLTGWMQTDSGLGRPIVRHLAPRFGPYISDAIAPVLLGATTLGTQWQARFSVLGWAVRDGDVSFPARLRVLGEERITVPAGTFDCWRVAIEASVGMQTYWVRKADGVGIRALLERDNLVRELVLTR